MPNADKRSNSRRKIRRANTDPRLLLSQLNKRKKRLAMTKS